MEIKYRQSFERDLDDIDNQQVLDDIAIAIENVENATKPQEIDNIKKLKGDKAAFRIKIGKYRIGFYMVKGIIEFTRVLPRDKIYRYFPE